MKVLVVGSKGMLARDVIQELDGSCEMYKRDLPELNICNRQQVLEEIGAIAPDVVINCAAYTDVDGCETNQEQAFAVNADGPHYIAEACKAAHCRLYHISTDFVFDGAAKTPYAESDSENPLSVYAKSKLKGEKNIQAVAPAFAIIRTSWLFGTGGKNFVSTIRDLSDTHDELRIVHDQTGCPTYTVDLARAIKALLAQSAQGLFHVCNAGMCSWYEFAVKIIELSGCHNRVVPITSRELARPAVRPQFSVMNCRKFLSFTGLALRQWETALEDYLNSVQKEVK